MFIRESSDNPGEQFQINLDKVNIDELKNTN